MSIEAVFDHNYLEAIEASHKTHKRTALYTGTVYSVGLAMNVIVTGVHSYLGQTKTVLIRCSDDVLYRSHINLAWSLHLPANAASVLAHHLHRLLRSSDNVLW